MYMEYWNKATFFQGAQTQKLGRVVSVTTILLKSKVSQNSSHQVSQFEILQGLIDQGRFVSPESSGGGSYLKVYRCC